MSQYAVTWNEKTSTFTIKDEGDKPTKNAIAHIYEPMVGEIPDAASHPQPAQLLEDHARVLGVAYRFVTVVNESSNERLDKLVKTGDEVVDADRTVQVVTGTAAEGKDGEDTVITNETELRAPHEA